ncbi:MAG: glycosyltransferase [Bacteroidetes bacterium]|nr:glycosyltransferase [Bacteroidota bacterium]
MKVLCVLNGGLAEKKGIYYVNNTIGAFFEEILKGEVRLSVFYMSESVKNLSNMTDYAIPDTIDLTTVKVRNFKLLTYLLSFIKLIKLVYCTDFVYIFYPGSLSPLLLFLTKIFNKKIGLYVRGEIGLNSNISRFLLKKSSFVLSVSDYFNPQIKKYCNTVSSIRPMISMRDEEIIQDREYIQKKEITFLVVGRLELRKGIYDILHAVRLLVHDGYTHFHVAIVGDGPDEETFIKLVNDANLNNYFQFYGSVSNWHNLKQFYIDSDVFILPSHDEGFPRVIYEAMGMGIPIITTFVGGISYLMIEGKNCYKINTGDPADIVSKMKLFLQSYKEYSTIAKEATKTVSSFMNNHPDTHGTLFLRKIQNTSL